MAGRATDLVRAPDGDLIVLGQPLRKLGADGAERWNKAFARDGSVDTAQGVAVDAAGRLHVVGLFDGEETFGGDTFQSQSGNTAFYAIFGADGGHVASAAYGGEHSTVLDRVVGLPDGGVVVAGTYTGDDVDFGGGLLPPPGRVAFDRRVVLARMDDPATHRWSVGLDFGQRAPQVQALERAADGDVLLWVSMNTAVGLDLGTGVVTDVPGPAQLLIRVGVDDGAVKAVHALVGAQVITPGVGRAGGNWCVAGTASRRITAGTVELGPQDPMTQTPSGFAVVLDDTAAGGAAFDLAFPLPGPPDYRLDQVDGLACVPDGAGGLFWFGWYRGMVDLAGPLPAGTQNRRPFLARLSP